MLRSPLPPLHGFLLILRDSLTSVIRLGKSQLCLYLTVLSLALEFGNALRVPKGRDREQTGNGVQHEIPASSLRTTPFSHAQQLTLEFATLPDRVANRRFHSLGIRYPRSMIVTAIFRQLFPSEGCATLACCPSGEPLPGTRVGSALKVLTAYTLIMTLYSC